MRKLFWSILYIIMDMRKFIKQQLVYEEGMLLYWTNQLSFYQQRNWIEMIELTTQSLNSCLNIMDGYRCILKRQRE